jgi:hypothetical protein
MHTRKRGVRFSESDQHFAHTRHFVRLLQLESLAKHAVPRTCGYGAPYVIEGLRSAGQQRACAYDWATIHAHQWVLCLPFAYLVAPSPWPCWQAAAALSQSHPAQIAGPAGRTAGRAGKRKEMSHPPTAVITASPTHGCDHKGHCASSSSASLPEVQPHKVHHLAAPQKFR